MARANAATSLSLTIGVACATLLVVGGILGGPAVLDCTHQPARFGLCLREKFEKSAKPPAVPVAIPVAIPAEPPIPPSILQAPLLVATPPDPGWIAARANEYQPARAVTVASVVPAAPWVVWRTALPDAPPPVPPQVIASLGALPIAAPAATPPATVLAPPLPPAPPRTAAPAPSVELRANVQPAPPLVRQSLVQSPKPQPPRAAVAKPKPRSVVKTRAPAPRPFKYDPRYPNVLVLPRPATGASSSFATLHTR